MAIICDSIDKYMDEHAHVMAPIGEEEAHALIERIKKDYPTMHIVGPYTDIPASETAENPRLVNPIIADDTYAMSLGMDVTYLEFIEFSHTTADGLEVWDEYIVATGTGYDGAVNIKEAE